MADFPSDIFRDSVAPTINSNTPVVLTDSRSLITRARRLPGQRWQINLRGIVLPQNVNQFNAFLFPLYGPQTTFTYSLNVYGDSSASNKTTLVDATIGQTVVQVNNADGVEPGQYFQFLGSIKMYMVTGVTTVGPNRGITFFPELTRNFDDGSSLNFQTPEFRLRLTGNTNGHQASSVRHPANYSLNTIEVL